MNSSGLIEAARVVQDALNVISVFNLAAATLPQPENVPDGSCFDYIVVGAGSAGCVIASRLSELPGVQVLLIEAGPVTPLESAVPALDSYLINSRYDWNYTSWDDGYSSQANKGKVLALTRGRTLGGSSAINSMFYIRGAPHDYDAWATIINDSRWNYDNVLPFFIKSERLQDCEVEQSQYKPYHGTEGYMGVSRQPDPANKVYLNMFNELGNQLVLDVNGRDNIGYTQPMYTILDGRRQDTAYAFLSPGKKRGNLHVMTETLVTEIIFDGNNRAVGVRALTKDNQLIGLEAKIEVIVSAGAFNSAQLLMLSGIGPKTHLEDMNIPVRVDLPVGENLQDHPVTALFIDMQNELFLPPEGNPYKFPARAIMGFVTFNSSQDYGDYQSTSITRLTQQVAFAYCSITLTLNDTICFSLFENARSQSLFFGTVSDLHPRSRGRVLLRSRDPREPPIIITGYFSNNKDLVNQARYLKDYFRLTQSSYFQKAGGRVLLPRLPACDGLELFSDAYWQCYTLYMTSTIYHYVGTCALGSVVDAELRVRGVQQLRVVDASVMPLIPSGNTNAPSIMIGEKGAYFIKQAYRKRFKNNRR